MFMLFVNFLKMVCKFSTVLKTSTKKEIIAKPNYYSGEHIRRVDKIETALRPFFIESSFTTVTVLGERV